MLGNTSNSLRTDDCTHSLPLAQLAAERGVGELEQYAGYWSLCTKYLPLALLCRWIKCWETRVVRRRKMTNYLIMHALASPFLQLDKVLRNSNSTRGIGDCALRFCFSSPFLYSTLGTGDRAIYIYVYFYLSPGPSSSWGKVLGYSSSTLGIGDCTTSLFLLAYSCSWARCWGRTMNAKWRWWRS